MQQSQVPYSSQPPKGQSIAVDLKGLTALNGFRGADASVTVYALVFSHGHGCAKHHGPERSEYELERVFIILWLVVGLTGLNVPTNKEVSIMKTTGTRDKQNLK